MLAQSSVQFRPPILNPVCGLTEVRLSTVAGLGLFAKEFIPKGTVWWAAHPGDVMFVNQAQWATLSASVHSPAIQPFIDAIVMYSYYVHEFDSLVLCLDNARHVNHSFTPNSGSSPDKNPLVAVALRDIEPGEEIFEDYTKYDQCPWAWLYEDFMERKDTPNCE